MKGDDKQEQSRGLDVRKPDFQAVMKDQLIGASKSQGPGWFKDKICRDAFHYQDYICVVINTYAGENGFMSQCWRNLIGSMFKKKIMTIYPLLKFVWSTIWDWRRQPRDEIYPIDSFEAFGKKVNDARRAGLSVSTRISLRRAISRKKL